MRSANLANGSLKMQTAMGPVGNGGRILLLVLASFLPLWGYGSEALEVTQGAVPHHPQQPQLTVDGLGNIHLVYGIGDRVIYRRSVDAGRTFSTPVELPFSGVMSLGMRRGPRIAATNFALCVTAVGGQQGKGRDGDLLAVRSSDGGQGWTGPVRVNDVPDSAREGLHAMSAGPHGDVCCVWLDLRSGTTEVMASCSTDGGSTWTKNELVYRSPEGSVCECCHPSVTMDDHGIHVQWRNSLDGARDMYVSSSADAAKSFSKASKLPGETWKLDACPMDGGAIAATLRGRQASVWRRENQILLFVSGDRMQRLLGTGEQPWVAGTDDGPFIVWLKQRGETLYLWEPGAESPQEIAGRAFDPVVATFPHGRSPVVVAWETRAAETYRIWCQVVRRGI